MRRLLKSLLWFGAVSALCGGFLGVVLNGAGLPLAYLEGTPFTSFVVPGLILGVVVGGTQMAAAVLVGRTSRLSALSCATAGFGMVLWIFAELALLGEFSWLQVGYFGLGVAEIVCVLLLLSGSMFSTLLPRTPSVIRGSASSLARDPE